ncbi:hypothetical protein HHI36_013143 [Cryptolaemus montrouzieri]|uniref:Uncharacterized protein n=1 Tax=Cryptolaemus montrouzieri TaxID=559131 RepID=A0ABD2NGF5_9CUCU
MSCKKKSTERKQVSRIGRNRVNVKIEVQEGLEKEDVIMELTEKVNLEEMKLGVDGTSANMETVILRRVDKGLSKKEIGDIIEEEVGNEPHIRISDRERMRVVFMTSEDDEVRELIRKRFIGWERWKVEEKVEPIECH